MYSFGDMLSDYWSLLEGRRLKFIFFSFMRFLAPIVPYINTLLVGIIIDFFTTYKQGDNINLIYAIIVSIATLTVVGTITRSYSKLKIQKIGFEIRKEARIKAMDVLLEQEITWHEKELSGSKIQRIESGTGQLYDGFHMFANEGANISVTLVASIGFLLILGLKYSIFATIYAIIFFLFTWHFDKKISASEKDLVKRREKISGQYNEVTTNILSIKTLGLGKAVKKTTRSHEDGFFNKWFSDKQTRNNRTKILNSVGGFFYAGFIYLVVSDVIVGTVSVGMIIVLITYFTRLQTAFSDISNQTMRLISIKIGMERIMSLIKLEKPNNNGKLKIKSNWREICFDNVYFKYKDKTILKGLSFKITKGDKIGLVGMSGSGKSTIVKLILGLYEPIKGKITIDGKNINQFSLESRINMLSVVLQETELFNVSLKENITMNGKKCDEEKLKLAIKISQIEKLIKKLPKGLNTLIGERGYRLSGGERQRINIARAIFKNHDILIFDEATSSLDSKTETNIQKRIDGLLKKTTMILIAHRLSTLKNVNRIIVIDNGKKVEEGNFQELIDKKCIFESMYKLQKHKQV